MEEHKIVLSKSEGHIRRVWLLLTIQIPVFLTALSLLFSFLTFFLDQHFMNFLTHAGSTLFSLAFLGLYYYCAYKNPGTIWLTFSVVILSIACFISLAATFVFIYELGTYALFFGLIPLYQGILLYYTLGMRKINKERQRIIKEDLLSSLSAIVTQEDLQEKIKQIEQIKPRKIRRELLEACEKRKKTL